MLEFATLWLKWRYVYWLAWKLAWPPRLFFDYDAFCSDLTGVAIDRKVRVAEELNALDFEGIEQDIGEVVGRVVDTAKGNLVVVLVTLEVVEELEPELLVSTILPLVVLVVGVLQSREV